jgi:EmrB/QacA subfamily drug resistance transporter
MTRRATVLIALLLAAFVINLDTTIVNVALPSLVRQLHASTTDLQWIVDAYNLTFAALVLAAGSLGDRLGRKGVLLAGLALFGVASLAGSVGTTANELIAARAMMGLGAALIFPATLSLISNVFTKRRERAQAIGLWGATAGVGIALGPIVGGWLLEHFWWGSVFLLLAPVSAGIAVLVAWAVPTSRDPSTPPLDWPGLLLSAAGMGAVIFSVIEAPGWGWGSARTVAGFLVGAVLLTGFALAEHRTAHPMLDVRLFHNLRFTAASGSVTIAFFALTGFIFLVTQYFQFVKDFSPFGTGVRLLPVASSVAVSSVLGTRLAVAVGNKVVVAAGMFLSAVALLWISTASQFTSYGVIAAQMLVLGTGMGLTSAPATEAILGVVPKEKAGVGSAVNDATRLFGATLGVAVIGSVAASLYSSRLTSILPSGLPHQAVSAAQGSVGGAVEAAHRVAQAGLGQAARQLSEAGVLAFLHSFAGGCLVAAGAAALGSLLAATLLPSRPRVETRVLVNHPLCGGWGVSRDQVPDGMRPELALASPAAGGTPSEHTDMTP